MTTSSTGAKFINDVVGNSLNISQAANPTFVVTGPIITQGGGPTFAQTSPPFKLTFTKIGNLVFMEWSSCVGTITGSYSGISGLFLNATIPSAYMPTAASGTAGFYAVPDLITSLSPLGTQDSASGYAAIPYIGFAIPFTGLPGPFSFGTESTTALSTATNAIQLAAGSMVYHV